MHGVLQMLSLLVPEFGKPLLPERCEFLAIGHKLGAFAQIGAINPEHLVVGAGLKVVVALVAGPLAVPHPDPFQFDDSGFVVLHRDSDAAIAIDATAEYVSWWFREHVTRRSVIPRMNPVRRLVPPVAGAIC
jgi:hypothetical protein